MKFKICQIELINGTKYFIIKEKGLYLEDWVSLLFNPITYILFLIPIIRVFFWKKSNRMYNPINDLGISMNGFKSYAYAREYVNYITNQHISFITPTYTKKDYKIKNYIEHTL